MTVDAARLARLKTVTGAAPEPSTEWSYGPPLADWLGSDEPDEDDSSDWHIRGLIARDVAGFFAGDMKVGKTMIKESQAVALAMGAADWCGFPIYGRKRVLIMPREDGERTTKARLWQLARGAGLERPHELAEWLSVDPTSPLNLEKPEHIAKLREACERFDVIMIDSFTTAHLGDENSAKDVARALEPARDLAISTKTSIEFIHHFNGKGNPDDKRGVKHRMRGSSAIGGYARHIVGAYHGPTKGTIRLDSDGNLEHQIEPFVVRLVGGLTPKGKKTLRYEAVGLASEAGKASLRAEVLALVASSDDGYASANAIWKELGGNRKEVLAAIKAELQPGGGLCPEGRRIVATGSGTSRPSDSGTSSVPAGAFLVGETGSRNHLEPVGTSSGSGSSLFRENQEPQHPVLAGKRKARP